MAIVGDHPESGVRFVFERGDEPGPPWVYRGSAFTPDTRFPLEVSVSSEGDVELRPAAGDGPPADLCEKIRLLFRTLYRQREGSPGGGEPPRKVVRWRGEK